MPLESSQSALPRIPSEHLITQVRPVQRFSNSDLYINGGLFENFENESQPVDWDRNRCLQRIIAICFMTAVSISAALTSLEYDLLVRDIKLPPYVCERVPDRILIKANFTNNVWEGFGTSLGWWAAWAGSLSKEDRTALVDDFFNDEVGLGFNIARYNIGGGGFSEHDDRFKSGSLQYRAIPGFKFLPNSPYNWTQDHNQRTILLDAIKKGARILEAYCYSPPAWMTISGDFSGAAAYKVDNLDPANYAAYATYMSDVVEAYRDKYNVEFDHLSPVNEPVEGWWVAGNIQEGCNFNAESLDSFLPFVKQALQFRGLNTTIAAFDSWASNTPKAWEKFSTVTRKVTSRINVHSYQPLDGLSYTDSLDYRQKVASLAKSEGKSVHMSEWGPYFLTGSDLDVALFMGRTITLDINILGAESWSYWQAIEDFQGEPYWGLVYINYSDLSSKIYRKQYYVMMQFSRWITPGSRFIKADESCQAGLLVAFQRTRQRLVLVVTNEFTRELTRTFNFEDFVSVNETATVDIYRTSENENHAFAGTLDNLYLPGSLTRSIVPKSTTTYIISGVKRKGSASPKTKV